MFYEIAREGPPTKYEISRLRSFEMTGRLNNLLIQLFDTGTDFAFMFALFDQVGYISFPGSWELYAATVGNNCPGTPAFFGTDKDKVLALAIATAVVLGVNLAFRLLMAVRQIWLGRRDLQDWSDYVHCFVGIIVTMFDPWNGSLFINEVMVTKRLERTDYELAKTELVADCSLALIEDVPQLIIQIIYGAFAGQLDRTSVAWFLAIVSSCMSLAMQLHEIILVAWSLPKLKRIQEKQDALNPQHQ